MDRVEVGRYSDSETPDWEGWVGTSDWIVFKSSDGELHVFHGRGENGAVKGDGVVVNPPEVGSGTPPNTP